MKSIDTLRFGNKHPFGVYFTPSGGKELSIGSIQFFALTGWRFAPTIHSIRYEWMRQIVAFMDAKIQEEP